MTGHKEQSWKLVTVICRSLAVCEQPQHVRYTYDCLLLSTLKRCCCCGCWFGNGVAEHTACCV